MQYRQGCAVRIRHIFSISDNVQCKSGTISVQARISSMNQAHRQQKRGYAVQVRHIFIISEDVQYESGTSVVQVRMCSTSTTRTSFP